MRHLHYLFFIGVTLFSFESLRAQIVDQEEFNQLEAKVIEWRRDFNQHPELGNREYKTAEKIAVQKSLKTLNVRCLEAKGNVFAYQEKYEEATKSYCDAIKKGGEISEKESIRGYASLGYVFKKLGNTKRSRDYC